MSTLVLAITGSVNTSLLRLSSPSSKRCLTTLLGDVHTRAEPSVNTGRSLVALIQIEIIADNRLDYLGVQSMGVQPLVREL